MKACLRNLANSTLRSSNRNYATWVCRRKGCQSTNGRRSRKYRMFRIATTGDRRKKNHYWNDLVLKMETTTRLDDNKKRFRLFHKAVANLDR